MIALLCLAAPSPPPPRAIHYVIRVSELEEVLEFTDKVLGMKVLRHEENEAACEITCNGDFDNAWSKTMVRVARAAALRPHVAQQEDGGVREDGAEEQHVERADADAPAARHRHRVAPAPALGVAARQLLAPRAAADAVRGANQPVAVREAVGGGGAREVGVRRHRLSRVDAAELRGVNADSETWTPTIR